MVNTSKDNKPTQEQVWDDIALWWNKYKIKGFGTKDSILEEFIDKKDEKVLDLGCGSGRNFFKFKWFKGTIYGVDFSKEMLNFAEKNADQNKIKVEIHKSNAWDLSLFEDGFFDKVLCIAVLHCIDSKEKRDKTIKEMYRVLKPGGKLLITVWNKKAKRWKNKSKDVKVSWSLEELEKGKKVTRNYYLYDSEELMSDLESVGFSILKANNPIARNIVFIASKD